MSNLVINLGDVQFDIAGKCQDFITFLKGKLKDSKNKILDNELKSLVKLMNFLIAIIQKENLSSIAKNQENEEILFIGNKNWKNEIESLKRDIQTEKTSLQNSKKEISDLQNKLNQVNNNVEQRRQEIQGLNQEIQAKNTIANIIEDFQNDWQEDSNNQIEHLTTQVEELTNQLKQAEQEIKYKDDHFRSTFEQYQHSKKLNSNPQCQDNFNELFYDYNQIFNENDKLKQKIQEVINKNSQMPDIETIYVDFEKQEESIRNEFENKMKQIQDDYEKNNKCLTKAIGVLLIVFAGASVGKMLQQ